MEMTCTEESTIESDYENQQSYLKDSSKIIFIVVDLHGPKDIGKEEAYLKEWIPESEYSPKLAGDVNLFFGKEGELTEEYLKKGEVCAAEISIMIAEKECQRKGLGLEAVQLMMKHGIEKYKVTHFIAKVSFKNEPSKRLFGEKLGYKMLREIEAFEEIHYLFEVTL